jgi:hypothetical protein
MDSKNKLKKTLKSNTAALWLITNSKYSLYFSQPFLFIPHFSFKIPFHPIFHYSFYIIHLVLFGQTLSE